MRYVLDIETYVNYFLMMWIPEDGSAPSVFEKFNDVVTISDVDRIDWSGTFFTFNGKNYDFPMWGALWAGKTNAELKYISDSIIVNRMMPWIVEREFGINIPSFDHIDIIQVLPGTGSLKIYGGRSHSRKLQDLPIEPSATIASDDCEPMRLYCKNDCDVTWEQVHLLEQQIQLRVDMGHQYGLDLRSKSDAQIAEAVIASEYTKRTGRPLYKPDTLPRTVTYKAPPFVEFRSNDMKEQLFYIEQMVFDINQANGQVKKEKELEAPIEFGAVKYQMGLGGLHSVDGPGSFYADDDHLLFDIDVASYYPNNIINGGFAPERMGRVFIEIYSEIVKRRLAAKAAGDSVTAESLKIVINGTFGKFGSMYSKLYSPDLMLATTLTGQLCLLMLIERLQEIVISANTDGIMVTIPKDDLLEVEKIVSDWELDTGLVMEWTEYKSVHRRDVNNYLAIKPDNSVKGKGVFTKSGFMKNPANEIIYESLMQYYLNDTPVEHTIRNCKDITKFLTLRTVKGGAKWGEEILGKSVRWYHSWLSCTQIEYQTNGNKVPLSDNSVPLQDLPDKFPNDVDHHWYINEARKLKGVMG